MGIEVLEEGRDGDSADLGTFGSIEVRTGAEIAAPILRVTQAILFRWRNAPTSARMSQTVAFRGFAIDRGGVYRAIRPSSPATDIRTRSGQHFYLSPPTGALRWALDALHDPRHRDSGRAYVTDESYFFTDRSDGVITFHDSPKLWFWRGASIVRAYGGASRITWLELLARFRTHLWVGDARVGLVEWVCTWRGSSESGELPEILPTYESVDFYTGPPSDGPSDAELRRTIRDWQRDDRRLRRPGR